MPTNPNKGEAYKIVISKLNVCSNSEDIFHLIGLVAASESIMSDRLSAFLSGINNQEYLNKSLEEKFVSFGQLIEFSKKESAAKITVNGKDGNAVDSKSLFQHLKVWNTKRNQIIHALCKSKSAISHKSQKTLLEEAKDCCIEAHRLVRLILKWSYETKRNFKNKVLIKK
jgi:hypothetical protein